MAIFEQVIRLKFAQTMPFSKKVTRDTRVARCIFQNQNVKGFFYVAGEKKMTVGWHKIIHKTNSV